jgi:hypothetical protein
MEHYQVRASSWVPEVRKPIPYIPLLAFYHIYVEITQKKKPLIKFICKRFKYIHFITGKYKTCSCPTNLPAEHSLCEGSHGVTLSGDGRCSSEKIVTKEKTLQQKGRR